MPKLEVARLNFEVGGPLSRLEDIQNSPLFQGADVIILSTKYLSIDGPDAAPARFIQQLALEANDLDRLGGLIDEIKKSDKKVVVLSNTVEFKSIEGMPIFDWWLTRNRAQKHLGRLYYENIDQTRRELNKRIRKIATGHGAVFLEKADYMCDEQQQLCDGITEDGYKIFYDYGHYTLEGAKHFGGKMASTGWPEKAL